MPDFTTRKQNISKSPIWEKSQALTFHSKTETIFASMQFNTVKTCTELWKLIFLAVYWPHALSILSLMLKLPKRLYWVTFKLHRQKPAQEQISEQVPWPGSTGRRSAHVGQGFKGSQTWEWRLTFEDIVIHLWKVRNRDVGLSRINI